MRFPRRRLHREIVSPELGNSFQAQLFKVAAFPFHWHLHPEVELTLILAGRGLRFVADSIEEFREGDLCLLGSDCPHTWQSDAQMKTPVQSLVIQFVPSVFGDTFWKLPEMRRVADLLARSRRGLSIHPDAHAPVIAAMHAIVREPAGSARRIAALVQALTLLTDHPHRMLAAAPVGNPGTNSHSHQRLTNVLAYLHEHVTEHITQTQLAKRAGLAPSAFSRFFSRTVGKPFIDYVNDVRVGTACRALIESDDDITAIAGAAGFANLSNFNRRFRALKGMTPRDYRSRARQHLSDGDAAP